MTEIGMLLLSRGLVRTLQRKHHANSFPWAHVPKVRLANTIILTTKIRNIIVPQLLKKQESLKLNLRRKKKKPFHQRSLMMLQLLLQQKQKGKEGEKERVEKAKTEKERERRARAIDNSGSVQSPLFRPHCKCMVIHDQTQMFTFSRTPLG